jgi:serine protease AprX
MSWQNQAELPHKIYAEAVVRSASGKSLLDASYPVTSENVSRFGASSDRLQTTAQRLREAGFDVLDIGKVSITIAAAPEVYERSLHTHLEAIERPVIKELGKTDTATFINAVDQKPFGEIDVSQTEWQGLLDGIAINEPIFYFQHGLPSATPPTTSDKYLSVPEGVAQGLNAVLAHQQGITGKGVKVAMVDSGWYAHPFFTQRNYKVDVVLAPGSTDKWRDDSGHGTGESANVLAIAPDVSLTMVKADVALSGKFRHINSISAFRTAIALQPDIITCSWGSDQRKHPLSPQNRVFAALVADAVRQGMIVIFSAGNGQHGFPAQHPDVIAAGGVYLHLNGSLRGTLEASNYASSFVSPIYPERRVPDVCGLVGNLPHGSYIMLPVPPGSKVDQQLATVQDGTEAIDGWAALSGTSAAAPQLAGICALMKQVNPGLSPTQVKQILQQTARDVVEGFSNPSSSGAPARAGPDLATGYGLVDAQAAIQAVQALAQQSCCDDCTASNQPFSTNYLAPQARQPMYSQFPKLQKKLDALLWKMEQALQAAIDNDEIEEVELSINVANFIPRSPVTKVAYYLRDILENCLETGGKVDKSKISEEHVSAAQGLLKIGRYQETAINVLTQALLKTGTSAEAKSIRKLASEALSECGSEITVFSSNGINENALLHSESNKYRVGDPCTTNGNKPGTIDSNGHCTEILQSRLPESPSR